MLIARRAQSQIEFKKEGKGELHNKTHQNNLETTFVAMRPPLPRKPPRSLQTAPKSSPACAVERVCRLWPLFYTVLSFLVKRMNL